MYRKLKENADMILNPAMDQLNALETILRQNNPKMLMINKAIAEATKKAIKSAPCGLTACWMPMPAPSA